MPSSGFTADMETQRVIQFCTFILSKQEIQGYWKVMCGINRAALTRRADPFNVETACL
jgi:squalene cyclase